METKVLSWQRFLSSHLSASGDFCASYGCLSLIKSSPIVLSLNLTHKTFTVGRYSKSHQQTLSTGALRWLSFSASLESNTPRWASIQASTRNRRLYLSGSTSTLMIYRKAFTWGKPRWTESRLDGWVSMVLERPWLFIHWMASISLRLKWYLFPYGPYSLKTLWPMSSILLLVAVAWCRLFSTLNIMKQLTDFCMIKC